MTDIIELHASIAGGPERKFVGRFAWALSELIQAGDRGCTPIDQPAPRWSHYVHRLRQDGIDIETVSERHEGPFAGGHGRYVLRSPVAVVSETRASS